MRWEIAPGAQRPGEACRRPGRRRRFGRPVAGVAAGGVTAPEGAQKTPDWWSNRLRAPGGYIASRNQVCGSRATYFDRFWESALDNFAILAEAEHSMTLDKRGANARRVEEGVMWAKWTLNPVPLSRFSAR